MPNENHMQKRRQNTKKNRTNFFKQPLIIFTYFRTWLFIAILICGGYLYLNPDVREDLVNHFTKEKQSEVEKELQVSKKVMETCQDVLNMTVSLSREKQSVSFNTFESRLEELKNLKTIVSKESIDNRLTEINEELIATTTDVGNYVLVNYKDFSWSMDFLNIYSNNYDKVKSLQKQQHARIVSILDEKRMKYKLNSDGTIDYQF